MAKHLTTKTVAELVSGSISRFTPKVLVERWMLKRVQHDEHGDLPCRRG